MEQCRDCHLENGRAVEAANLSGNERAQSTLMQRILEAARQLACSGACPLMVKLLSGDHTGLYQLDDE